MTTALPSTRNLTVPPIRRRDQLDSELCHSKFGNDHRPSCDCVPFTKAPLSDGQV